MNDTATTANGVAEGVKEALTGPPLTEGYHPTLPLWMLTPDIALPQLYLLRDVELMMIHPMVRTYLNYYKGGISGAEFWGGESPDGNPSGKPISDMPEVAAFVKSQVERFWDRGVPKIQGGYEYGWIGCEALYKEVGNLMAWDDLDQFSPRDVFLLTQDYRPVGVRVKNVRGKSAVDLWMASDAVPAKGLWYAHEPRYNRNYGQSQLIGAWRPWRRLASKDGAETVVDTGVYRFAYSGPIVRYPEEDSQASAGAPATSLDSQGRPRRFARDVARQIAEWVKAGAGVGLPSSKYPQDMGGGDKWDYSFPDNTLNVDGLINYVRHLWEQIAYGIGVPPELMAASETGSGYSGRAIPMEAFLAGQQRIADALLNLFVDQVLRPLVHWNWGPQARFEVKVKNLLQTKRLAQAGQAPGSGGMNQPGGQQPGQQQPQPQAPGSSPGWPRFHGMTPQPVQPGQMMSLEVTDRVRQIAQKIHDDWRARKAA